MTGNAKRKGLNTLLSLALLAAFVGIWSSGLLAGTDQAWLAVLVGITSCAAYALSYLFLSNSMDEGKALWGIVLSLILWYVIFLMGMAEGQKSIEDPRFRAESGPVAVLAAFSDAIHAA